jgi:hypothetical protein
MRSDASSGLAAVLVATAPFWMAAVEAVCATANVFVLPLSWDSDGIRRNPGAGLPDLSVSSPGSRTFLVGLIALQIASLGWALGSSYSKRHAIHDDLLGTAAFQMLAGGIIMMLAGTIRGEWSQLFWTTRTVGALVYLSTIGAIGGFVAYTYALRHLSVSFVSLYAYINPVIAVTLSVLCSTIHSRHGWRLRERAESQAVLWSDGNASQPDLSRPTHCLKYRQSCGVSQSGARRTKTPPPVAFPSDSTSADESHEEEQSRQPAECR